MGMGQTSGRPGDGAVPDDLVQPFHIEGQRVMGRLVRLGPLVDEVLHRHEYPEDVATLLAEMLALAAGLSTLIKYDGIFSLQAKGDGPVGLLVADATSGGDLRGYASYDAGRLAGRAANGAAPLAPVPRLLGQGYLAFTVDQGANTERYQGIVALDGATLVDCVHHYFRQSEQLPTGIKLAVGAAAGEEDGWRAGVILLQRLPGEGGAQPAGEDAEEGWRRAMVLMASATSDELLDPALAPNDLLYRLFHEDGVRVTAPHSMRARCRCSRDRVETVLRALPRHEVEELKVDGEVVVTCEFCSRRYTLDEADLARLFDR